ncbi:MAG: hypothetical protein ACR2NP_01405, partial [Pirellulaceae bacterium]
MKNLTAQQRKDLDKLLQQLAPPPRRSGLRTAYLLIPFVLCVVVALAPGSLIPKALQQVATPVVEEPPSEDEQRVTQRLIPDQKALIGAPNTTIDLGLLFQATELGKTGEPITLKILRTKKDVATVTLEDQILTIDWQAKTGKKRDVLIRASTPSGNYVDTKFYVELWEPDYKKLILTVIGGLGIFLLGMKFMSEGLQAIAGNGLRKMISWVTNNRLMAIGVGTLITMLVQSSS